MNVSVEIVDGPLISTRLGPTYAAGAILTFEGRVRPQEGNREILGLVYETYDPMALTMLRTLAEMTMERFGLLAVHAEHSRGTVFCGDCSFRLEVAATHRKEALAAIDSFIDQMKQDVPIWKVPLYCAPVEISEPQKSC